MGGGGGVAAAVVIVGGTTRRGIVAVGDYYPILHGGREDSSQNQLNMTNTIRVLVLAH